MRQNLSNGNNPRKNRRPSHNATQNATRAAQNWAQSMPISSSSSPSHPQTAASLREALLQQATESVTSFFSRTFFNCFTISGAIPPYF